jgi:hypothetical protein
MSVQFLRRVLWTDEALFTRTGVHNRYNLHVTENPHISRHYSYQQGFSVNVFAGIIDEYTIEPNVIHNCLDEAHYTDFVGETLPILLVDVPLHARETVRLEHDGALPTLHTKCVTGLTTSF